MSMSTRLYPLPVRFGYGNEDEFFLWRWIWDSKTRLVIIPNCKLSLFTGKTNKIIINLFV